MSKKDDVFQAFDEIVKSTEEKPKKKGRPKKKVEEKPSTIEVNEERFKEEIDRIINYLGKLQVKQISPSEMISILQDLEIITETNGLSKDTIIDQLRELVKGR